MNYSTSTYRPLIYKIMKEIECYSIFEPDIDAYNEKMNILIDLLKHSPNLIIALFPPSGAISLQIIGRILSKIGILAWDFIIEYYRYIPKVYEIHLPLILLKIYTSKDITDRQLYDALDSLYRPDSTTWDLFNVDFTFTLMQFGFDATPYLIDTIIADVHPHVHHYPETLTSIIKNPDPRDINPDVTMKPFKPHIYHYLVERWEHLNLDSRRGLWKLYERFGDDLLLEHPPDPTEEIDNE